jgi:hypothetical protein
MGSAARTPLGSLMAARLSNQLMRLSRTPVTLIRRVGRPSAVACAGIRAVRSAKFGCNHLRYFLQHSSLFPGQTAGFFAVSFATSTRGRFRYSAYRQSRYGVPAVSAGEISGFPWKQLTTMFQGVRQQAGEWRQQLTRPPSTPACRPALMRLASSSPTIVTGDPSPGCANRSATLPSRPPSRSSLANAGPTCPTWPKQACAGAPAARKKREG